MKKVRITESQLRGMVKKMIRENVETKYAELAKKGFNPQEIQNIKNNFSAVQILNKMDLNRDVINSDKQTIHTMLLQPDKVQMGTTTIGESQLRGMIRKMLMEQTPMSTGIGKAGFAPQGGQQQQKDQPIETAMLSALQRDTTLIGKLKTIKNFNQLDSLIKAIIGLTSIQDTQIKTGLASLSRMGVQTQAGKKL
jgi:hypothetical protein